MRHLSKFTTFLCLCFTACNSSDSSDDSSTSLQNSKLKGIYTISSYTRNSNDCMGEGDSILSENSPGFAFIDSFSIFGIQYLQVTSCESVEDCKDISAKIKNGDNVGVSYVYSFTFETGNDTDGYSGTSISTGFSRNAQCEEAKSSDLSLNSEDDASSIIIRKETKISDPFPTDADGFCTSDGAKAATESVECSQLEVFKAVFQQSL